MANEKTLVGKVVIDSSQAEQPIGNIKKALKEANAELLSVIEKFGEISPQAIEAAQKVAELKDTIGDAKELTDGFNPDAKFASFGNAVQGVIGGFAALQSAQVLFGEESKEVAEIMSKLQAAMALSQSINGIIAAQGSFKVLAAVIKTEVVGAFSSMKAAIASTGIGLLIVGIGILVEQLMSMSNAAEEAAASQRKLNEEQKKYADEGLKDSIKALDRLQKLEIARAKSRGASEEEIFQIEQDFRKRKGEEQIKYYNEVKNIDAKAANDALSNIKDINTDGQVAELENQTRLNNIKKQAREKDKEQRKQDEKSASEDLKKLRQENSINEIEDDKERAYKKIEIDKQNEIERIKNLNINNALRNKLLLENEQKYNLEKAKLDKQYEEENRVQRESNAAELEKLIQETRLAAMEEGYTKRQQVIAESEQAEIDKALELKDQGLLKEQEYLDRRAAIQAKYDEQRKQASEQFVTETLNKELDTLEKIINSEDAKFQAKKDALDKEAELLETMDKNTKEYTDRNEKYTKARMQIAVIEKNAKIEIVKAISAILGSLTDVIGKETAAGKAFAVAQTTIDTFVAAQTVFKQAAKNPITQVFPPYPFLMAAPAVISGIANVKKILSVPVPGGGGGGGSAPTPTGIESPLSPQAVATAIPQEQLDTLTQSNASQRAYVVESDVTTNQERIVRLNRAARIN